jgi:hypothetical protein
VGAGITTTIYTKDTTAPTFTILDGASATAVQSETITVSVADTGGSGAGATTYYVLSNDNVCNASDIFTLTGLTATFSSETDSTKYVCFRNTDAVGNIGYSTAIGPLIIDTTAPTGTLTNNGPQNEGSNITFTAAYSDTSGVLLAWDLTGGTCSSLGTYGSYTTQNYSLNELGTYQISLKVKDNLGNESGCINTAGTIGTWNNVAPTANEISNTVNEGLTNTLNVDATDPGGTVFGYQWYSDDTCTNTIGSATNSSYTAPSQADPTIIVYSYKVSDAQSLLSNCAKANAIWGNLSPTVTSVIKPANDVWTNDREFCLTATDPGGGFYTGMFSIGGVVYFGEHVNSGENSCLTIATDLDSVNWYGYAADDYGGESAHTGTFIAKINTEGTTLSASNTSSIWFNSRNTTLTVQNLVGIAQARYNWNSSAFDLGCTSGGIIFNNGEIIAVPTGSNRLYMCALDSLGVVKTYESAANTFRVDPNIPNVSANNSGSGWASSIIITMIASDVLSGIAEARYSWDSYAMDGYCSIGGTQFANGDSIAAPIGTHQLYLCARDNAGNLAFWDGQYNIDVTNPSIPGKMTTAWVDNSEHYINTDFTANTTGSTDIGGSGIASYALYRGEDGESNCSILIANGIVSTSRLVSGTHLPSDGQSRYYCWSATDGAGNTSDLSPAEFVMMNMSTPITDNFPALTITDTSSDINGTNFNATLETGEPDTIKGTPITNSVWYNWTPDSDGSVVIGTCNSEIPTIMEVYTGSALDALTVLTGTNTTCTNGNSVGAEVIAGTTYYIQIAGLFGQVGGFTLRINFIPDIEPPPPTPTLTPTLGPTLTPTLTPTITPTVTPSPTLTPTPLPTLTPTQTPYPTYTPLPTQTPYPTYTPRPTQTPHPTNTSTPTPTITPTPVMIYILLNDFPTFLDGTGKAIADLNLGQVIYFYVNNERHSATVKEIQASYVVLTLESTPFDLKLNIGETKSADVTGDGVDDIRITFNAVTNGKAEMTFAQLNTVQITELPETGTEKTCTISQPTIKQSTEGINNNAYSISFTTDNNQAVSCDIDYGNSSVNYGLSANPTLSSGRLSAILDISNLASDKSIYYRIECSGLDRQCIFNGVIPASNTSEGTSGSGDIFTTIGTAVSETFTAATQAVTNTLTAAKDVVESPSGKIVTIAPALGAVATLVAANPQALSSMSNMVTGFLWVFRKERKKRQGMVYGKEDSKPIPFAVIRLIDPVTKRVIKQTVSNLQGKYNLIIDPGVFTLEVSHDSYKQYSSEIKVPGTTPLLLAENLGLTKVAIADAKKIDFRKVFNKISKVLFVFGIVVSLFSVIVNFQLLNLVIFFFYLAQLFIMYLQRDPRGWGVVFDTNTKVPLIGGFMSILDPVEQRQVDVQITDKGGRFGFNLDDRDYLLRVSVPNYTIEGVNQNIKTKELPNGEITLIVNPKAIADLEVGMKRK